MKSLIIVLFLMTLIYSSIALRRRKTKDCNNLSNNGKCDTIADKAKCQSSRERTLSPDYEVIDKKCIWSQNSCRKGPTC